MRLNPNKTVVKKMRRKVEKFLREMESEFGLAFGEVRCLIEDVDGREVFTSLYSKRKEHSKVLEGATWFTTQVDSRML